MQKSLDSVLVVGGTGYVGYHVSRALVQKYRVVCTYRQHPPLVPIPGIHYFRADVLEKDPYKKIAHLYRPKAVIYCAGSNRIEDYITENDQKKGQMIHSSGPANVMEATDVYKAKFIYLSSDFIFSGKTGNSHENDTAMPESPLAKAKVGGENYVKSRSLNYVIIRSAPLLGRGTADHPSFLDRWRLQLGQEQVLKLSPQWITNPARIDGLCDVILRVLSQDVRGKLVHHGGLTKISLYELGKRFSGIIGAESALVQPEESGYRTEDYSLNFTQSMRLLKFNPLILKQGFDVL